uniref:Uncharacterized protein n=1 Tax=Timema bartmani TaxID=61472 RepID=A0A7R9EZN8_9NEOP|nr:unnamed protein product [Timema bartmani]
MERDLSHALVREPREYRGPGVRLLRGSRCRTSRVTGRMVPMVFTMPVVITIELCDPRDQVNSILMDNSMLDLHYPLISSADLWRPIILDTDHSELWDDSIEDVSPDYDNFMIDLES